MIKKSGFLVLLLLMTSSFCAQAALRPEWTRKGESSLNRKRTNTTYEFKVFKTEDASLSRLWEGRFYPLLEFLGEQYGVTPDAMALDSLLSRPGEPVTYRIAIPLEGHIATAWAQRVDVYSDTDYNTELDPVFEYYQLYAVSTKGVEPVFDTFERSERNKGAAALMNIIPGTGQLYKGHTFKGCVILGSEIALGAAAWSAHKKSLYYKDMVASGIPNTDSWQSKEIGMRRLRNTALIAMGGIWAFGLYDALATESMPFLYVSAPQGGQLTFAPAPTGMGLALVYRF